MTCDERLEQLLNRAGQTISELPIEFDNKKIHFACNEALGFFSANHTGEEFINTSTYTMLEYYILHLTDIIDLMETALENVIGERDYLVERASNAGVLDCIDCLYNGEDCNDRCYDGTGLGHGIWAGVPEDWRADDEQS